MITKLVSWFALVFAGMGISAFFSSFFQDKKDLKKVINSLEKQKLGSKIERENQENKENFNTNELISSVSRKLPDDKS